MLCPQCGTPNRAEAQRCVRCSAELGQPDHAARPAQPAAAKTAQPAARTAQPTARATQPAARTAQPAARTAQPTARTAQPTARTAQPTVRTTQPAARTAQPAARTTQPAAARTAQPTARTTPAKPSRAETDRDPATILDVGFNDTATAREKATPGQRRPAATTAAGERSTGPAGAWREVAAAGQPQERSVQRLPSQWQDAIPRGYSKAGGAREAKANANARAQQQRDASLATVPHGPFGESLVDASLFEEATVADYPVNPSLRRETQERLSRVKGTTDAPPRLTSELAGETTIDETLTPSAQARSGQARPPQPSPYHGRRAPTTAPANPPSQQRPRSISSLQALVDDLGVEAKSDGRRRTPGLGLPRTSQRPERKGTGSEDTVVPPSVPPSSVVVSTSAPRAASDPAHQRAATAPLNHGPSAGQPGPQLHQQPHQHQPAASPAVEATHDRKQPTANARASMGVMRHLFGANTSGGTSTNLEGSLPSDALAAHAEAVGEAPVLGEVPAQGEPPVVGETAQTALTLARPWQRLLGALVDSGLILFPVLGAISLGIFGGSVAHASLLEPEDVGLLLVNGDLSALIVVGLAITVIMSSLTTGLLGRSPGKLLFGLEVVTVRDGARPSLLRAISRAILTPVGMILGGSGLFWLLVDRKARTLHDVLSGTIVVVRSSRRVMA